MSKPEQKNLILCSKMVNYTNERICILIHVRGLVQGVGFRPFICRLAIRHHLDGWVENRNDGVRIYLEGTQQMIDTFIGDIKRQAPPAAVILAIDSYPVQKENIQGFHIRKSSDASEEVTEISPDIAVCNDCLEDLKSQPHRISYPFINCTNCGPRFTIIRDLPYDRDKTTMQPFMMCPVCRDEYENILDRRFHAQPVACNNCGPIYKLLYGISEITVFEDILNSLVSLIKDGRIIAIQGMGGFHLACDAMNDNVVKSLRERKNRDGKPFAVMFRDIESIRHYLSLDAEEESLMQSWRRPIVILRNLQGIHGLAKDVSNGFNTTGVMLPYLPLHYMLFGKLNIPAIVLTSGNISDEPIIIDNKLVRGHLSGVADAFLIYNREIFNRTDDSVMFAVNGKSRLIRRSRGFVPAPVYLNLNCDGIFAAGAELVNCFCVGKGQQAIMSQHIGDLKNLETLEFYSESVGRFKRLFRVQPTLIACDLHPDYLSTKFAREMVQQDQGLDLVRVQHHHAHIASCMAENQIDKKVIGVSLDGAGYGDDGHIWGSEFMVCDLSEYERITHLEYIPQPGGDKATEEPWRMAVSYLYKAYGDGLKTLGLPFLDSIQDWQMDLILNAIVNNINCPLTSGTGRLFDAVAALTGLCTHASFHAEAPMRLEHACEEAITSSYNFNIDGTIKTAGIIQGVVHDILDKERPGIIASKFHNTFINIIVDAVMDISARRNLKTVVLSGGSFQNRYLTENVEKILEKQGFEVLIQRLVPCNDGGIALGQLAIAAKKRKSDR